VIDTFVGDAESSTITGDRRAGGSTGTDAALAKLGGARTGMQTEKLIDMNGIFRRM
jgi:hypothetical protein